MSYSREAIVSLLNEGRNDEAIACLDAEAAGIGAAAAANFRGVALQQLGRFREAAVVYRQSAKQNLADLLNCWNNLAGACYHIENYAESVAIAENLRSYHPYDADLLGLHVLSLLELGKRAEAEQVARQFVNNLPRHIGGGRWMIHAAYRNRKRLEALLFSAEIGPNQWDSGGMAHELLQALVELDLGEIAQEIFPLVYGPRTDPLDRPETWATAAIIAMSVGDYVGARALYEAGMRRGYRELSATMNLSLIELATGDYENGWLHYMARAEDSAFPRQPLPAEVPRWAGEPVAGKTLMVASEQGMGDMIQFLRFIPELERLGARVVFSSYPDIVTLLANDPRAKTAAVKPLAIEEIDYYTLLLDLPYRLGVKRPADVPCRIPYLYANHTKSSHWREHFAALVGMKVGLAWAGNPDFQGDHYRSASINVFAPLCGVPGITFIGLQKGIGAKEARCPPEGLPYVWIGDQFANFEDTAAAIDNLDLVISTDTSIVHLAAALGKPVWLLLSRRSMDPRWVEFEGRNAWYPNVRAFRQESDDDWIGLIRNSVRPALANALLDAVAAGTPGWLATALAIDSGRLAWVDTDWDVWAEACVATGCESEATAWLARAVGERDSMVALVALHAACERIGKAPPSSLSVALARELLKGRDVQRGLSLLNELAQTEGDAAVGRMGFLDWGWYWRSRQDFNQAIALWQRGAAVFPRDGQLHYLQGDALKTQTKNKLALFHLRRALDCFPRHFKALTAIAEIQREEQFAEAVAAAQQALMLKCHDVGAWQVVAQLFHDRGMYWLAERILLSKGDLANNRYSQLLRIRQLALLDRVDEANDLLDRISWQGCEPVQHPHLLAGALYHCGRSEEAIALLEKQVAEKPEASEYRFSLGFSLLRAGRCREGWKGYWQGMERKNAGHFPEWEGQSLRGKSLLVIQDQGQGDSIQFFPLLQEVWEMEPKRLTLAVGRPLATLFRAQGAPFEVINLEQLDWEDYRYDYQVDQMALPHLLDVDLLAPRHTQPTLIALPGRVPKWQAILDADKQLKVGIVWSGGDLFKANYVRSTTLEDWRVLWEIEGISFYSLQKDIHSNEAAVFDRPLHNVAADCPTWLETLSIIASLDLVITTCTAVAHAAGSIDKPTWVILSNEHVDFRWLEDREDSPWYPSVRLIRRRLGESWRGLFRRVADDLVGRYDGLHWRDPLGIDADK
ncbi:MAG: hypothetical protein E6Q43_02635 [Dokdonella sp.]|nr:MAG: hypothetical protein E6Q43_02635 [Dokdonella sp.]